MKTFRTGDPATWAQSTWPSGQTGDQTTWTYDLATGALTGKTDAANEHVDYTYTKLGQLKTRTWARGVVTTYKYFGEDPGDPATGEQKSIDYSTTPSTNPDLGYTYDRVGRVAAVTDVTGTRTLA